MSGPGPERVCEPRIGLSGAERLDWLRLIRSRRVGPVTFHRLLRDHGSAAAALAALPDLARAAGVEGYLPCSEAEAWAELERGARLGAELMSLEDADYPPALAALNDAPPLLWLQGRRELLQRPMLALVGARNASALGLRMARHLARDLGAAGYVLVSGLARGIDAEAHRAALPGGTIAVQAGGVDVVWPLENSALAAEIAREGLRLSEHPPGLQPQARHFPARNRIVAGLVRAVLVVEAAAKSGSLITARAALDLGREVLAVPGHPYDARAAGCNLLIREGAQLLRSAADLPLPEGEGRVPIGRPPAHRTAQPTARAPARPRTVAVGQADQTRAAAPGLAAITRLHNLILGRLGPSPLPEDQLLRDLGLPPGEVLPELLSLEIEGQIQRAPGGMLSSPALPGRGGPGQAADETGGSRRLFGGEGR